MAKKNGDAGMGDLVQACFIDEDNAACEQIVSSTTFLVSAALTVVAGLAWFGLRRVWQGNHSASSKEKNEDCGDDKAGSWLPAGQRPVCVVTGSNRGLGLQIVKHLCLDLRARNPLVVLCSRNAEKGESAARGLKLDPPPNVMQLDITSDSSVESLAQWLQKNHGGIDVLVRGPSVCRPRLNHRQLIRNVKSNVHTQITNIIPYTNQVASQPVPLITTADK